MLTFVLKLIPLFIFLGIVTPLFGYLLSLLFINRNNVYVTKRRISLTIVVLVSFYTIVFTNVLMSPNFAIICHQHDVICETIYYLLGMFAASSIIIMAAARCTHTHTRKQKIHKYSTDQPVSIVWFVARATACVVF